VLRQAPPQAQKIHAQEICDAVRLVSDRDSDAGSRSDEEERSRNPLPAAPRIGTDRVREKTELASQFKGESAVQMDRQK
jgi:hypothetical protein